MLRRIIKKVLAKISTNKYEVLNKITLSKANLISNVELIRDQHTDQSVIPVLKANAYGHGLKEIAQILNDTECSFLAVDGYFEAAKIRYITKHPILVLGYIKRQNVKLLDLKKCSFVVQDIKGLQALGALNKKVKVHLELNTGMNRLGLQPDELKPYLDELKRQPNLLLEGVMTHLADADNDQDDTYTLNQTKQFDKRVRTILKSGFKPKYIHIAQTAGSTKVKSEYANSIRLGIGLYGISPLLPGDQHSADLKDLKPVLELRSTVIKVLNLQKGDRVSYNGIFTAPQSMKIGVLPLGYYEGVPRELSNKGLVSFEGNTLPIVGRVCMNHTMIGLNDTDVKVGDEVVVISRDPNKSNSIQKICDKFKLFNYSFMTGITDSIRRTIV
jgi:alanine racemase